MGLPIDHLMAGNDPIIRKLATVNDIGLIVRTLPPLRAVRVIREGDVKGAKRAFEALWRDSVAMGKETRRAAIARSDMAGAANVRIRRRRDSPKGCGYANWQRLYSQ
jgi:hypothetical protein